ncbi:MAG: inositol monophosphatase family protein [Actinomycetota bacterium]
MYEPELAFANELADRADEIALGIFGGEFEVRRKADQTPVTDADLAIEAMAREAITERFPGDAILGEEGGLAGEEGGREWVIDPIDGTKNFADGIQIWGTLIALMDEGTPVVGVASAPALTERYAAARGAGARLNGEPIHVSTSDDLGDALLAFGGLEVWVDGDHRETFEDLVQTVRRTRGIGDFWGHMLVARGAADVMIEPELRIWDWAALSPIVREAGGRMSTFAGGPLEDRGSVVTTNGPLHAEMLKRLAAV